MISKNTIAAVLEAAVSTGGDFAELFIEDSYKSSVNYLDGQLESTQTGRDFGVGIRIFSKMNCIYAYTNSFDRESLMETALKAAQAVNGANPAKMQVLSVIKTKNIHAVELMPDTVSKKRKLDLVRKAYDVSKGYDPLIRQASSRYADTVQHVAIANTDGLYREDTRVYARLMVNAVAEKDGQMQTGSANPGVHGGFEFMNNLDIEGVARRAAATAVTMVNADYCKAGIMPVVIDNAFGGVIFHEACGHGLEATSVAKGTSVFAGRIGERVAPEAVTAIDDGTLPNHWGSLNMDDEGNDTRRNVLIERGILKGYMVDRFNGMKMGMEATGSSRRQSYRYAPTSRMTNTFIANGKSKREELIASVDNGLYAKLMGGGSVNPGTGEFNFSVREGYMIRNGKIAEPVRGATLIGKGPDVLQKIDMVADNLDMDQGMCGSSSGSVPANVGQPAVRVGSITVGGR